VLTDIFTVFWRDWVVLKRRLTKFILSRMVAPLLYLVAFGWGLGRSITLTGGGSYLDFMVPGLMALNSMNIAFNSVTPIHAERVYHGSLEEYILAPIRPISFLLGKMLSAIMRALISSVIIFILATIFGASVTLSPLFIFVLVLNSLIFAEIGFIAAMKISTYEEMAQVNTYVLLPMSFLCGTFFSAKALPPIVSQIVELLPLTHASSLLRTLGGGGSLDLISLGVMLLYAAIFFIAAKISFASATDN